jgi:hypothetical protein
VDIIENPISIWESLKAPFKRLSDSIKSQVGRFVKGRQAKVEGAVSGGGASSIARDLLVGGGVAIAALGASLAYVTKALVQIKDQITILHVLGILVAVAVVILLPSIIMGIGKLRKRNMSILLEAAGWAVNVRMRLTWSLGRLFTHFPKYPEGSRKERRDALAGMVKEFNFSSARKKGRLLKVALVTFLICLGVLLVLIGYWHLRARMALR